MVAFICARTAWQKLGSMPQEEAMEQYVAVLTEIDPTWQRNQLEVQLISVGFPALLLWMYFHARS